MDFFTNKINTESLAIYGAILSTLSMVAALGSLIVQGIVSRRDRKSIKIEISEQIRLHERPPINRYKPNKDYISIKVINNGRRPVTITSIGAISYNGRKLLPTDFLKGDVSKTRLEENEKLESFTEKEIIDKFEIVYFYADDATGKRYKKYTNNILIRLIKKLYFLFNNLFR